MKIGIYSPYLDTAGGGEKYILTVAEVLSKQEKVEVFLDQHLFSLDIDKIKQKIHQHHNLDLSKVNFIKAPFGKGTSFVERFFFLQKYDWFFYLTDGSFFFASAKNNIIHFQVPFGNSVNSLWKWVKIKSWNQSIYNSQFTQKIVEKSLPIKGSVIYPPVNVAAFKSLPKKKQILSVGRFFGYLKDKKQGVLIDAFKSFSQEKAFQGWSLHLAGGAGEGDQEYIEDLKNQAKGFDIHFHPNIPFEDLKNLYGQSRIYWHAAGFGETDPKKFEHFGITTVEAMAAGCVPVVINLGGQKEIVEDGVSGFLWNDLNELQEFTIKLIKDQAVMNKLSGTAKLKSQQYSKENFTKNIKDLVYGK